MEKPWFCNFVALVCGLREIDPTYHCLRIHYFFSGSQNTRNQQQIEQALSGEKRSMMPVGMIMRYVIRSSEEGPLCGIWY